MGVQGLLTWVKKAYPSAIQTFPKRWASPEIRGKKIAIDGTLLTNRFHFAIQDGELKGKGGLIGWYNLIRVLKAHDIKPIAIWDERGYREWKAPEARRRLAARALNLSRRRHEEERAERLSKWKEAFETFDGMSEVERELVREHWRVLSNDEESTRPKSQGVAVGANPSHSPSSSATKKPTPFSDAAIDIADAESLLQRVSDLTSTLTALHSAYRTSVASTTASLPQQEVAEAIQHVQELEQLAETSIPPTPDTKHREVTRVASVDMLDPPPEDEVTVLLDEKIEEVMPELMRETKRQEELTREEGEIIALFTRVHLGTEAEVGVKKPVGQAEASSGSVAAAEEQAIQAETGSATERTLSTEEGGTLEAIIARAEELSLDIDSASRLSGETSSEDRSDRAAAVADHQENTRNAHHLTREDAQSLTFPFDNSLPQPESPSTLADPLERLDTLLATAPSVKQIYDRALSQPGPHDHDACKDLLRLMGVPVLDAPIPYEAEGLAASLAKAGIVDYVGTEDSDVIAYEGPLLRNLSTSTLPLNYIPPSLRDLITLSPSAFLDFCILLGTDASPRIPSIGPARAYPLMLKYGSIEKMLASEPKIAEKLLSSNVEGGQEGFMSMVRNARELFGKLPPVPKGVTIEQGRWSEKEVEEWLAVVHGVGFEYNQVGNEVGHGQDVGDGLDVSTSAGTGTRSGFDHSAEEVEDYRQ